MAMLKERILPQETTGEVEFVAHESQAGLHVSATLPAWAMSPGEAQRLLTEPLEPVVAWQGSAADVVHGLMGYGYGNNVFAHNMRQKGRQTQAAVRQMTPDAGRLASILKADASHDELVRPARVASFDETAHYARDRLVTMKPTQLIELCQQLQMPIDELEIWRRKGGNRHNREIKLYDIDDAGADSERLRHELVRRLFHEIYVLDEAGVALHLIHRDDVPPSRWLSGDYITAVQGRELMPLADKLPRFEMAFHNDSVVERKIVPQLNWLVTFNEHGWPAYDRSNYEGGRYRFDSERRTLSLHSPIVGALAVYRASGLPQPDKLESVLGSLYLKHLGYGSAKQQRYARQKALPRTAIAGLPAVLADVHPTFSGTNPTFARIARQAYQDPAISQLLMRNPQQMLPNKLRPYGYYTGINWYDSSVSFKQVQEQLAH